MKRRLLVIFLTLCLILGLFPISASAADSGSLDVTTIYVSNQGGGDGASEKDPTTLESALETINRAESDTENPLKFIISITEDIEKTGTTDFYFKNHIVTLLGNGHKICTSGTIGATENTILYLGKADGSDSLTLEEIQRSQAHSVVSAGNGVSKGTVHMYDGVSVLGANDAFKNDSTGHGVRVNMGEFHMHGGEISGFCIPQPGAGVSVNNGEFYMYGGIIQNCMSKGGTQFGGGAIWGDGNSEIHILGGELKDNKADNRGGAIATQSAVAIEIKGNAKIIGNEANRGGAISIQNSSSLTITDEVEFSGNRCTRNGGAISALSGCAVTITGGTFKNNRSSTGYGGAIYHQGDASGENKALTVHNAIFTGNQAACGGAVLSLGGLGNTNLLTADFKDCTFQGNSTHCYETEDQEGQPVTDGGFGGAIYVQDVELTLDNCAIENNTAEDSGGGVYFTGNDPSLLTLNIKGATKIGDNSAPKAENLYLLNIALPGSTEEGSAADEFQTVLTVSDSLTTAGDQAEIGIYMDKPGVFTSGYSKQCGEVEPSIYFKSDHSDYHVEWSAEGNEATLKAGAAEYMITATAGANGSISPSGAVTVTEGGNQTFIIIPDSSCHVEDVLVDGKSIGVVTSYTFEKVTASHTISAVFDRNSSGGGTAYYTLHYESNGGTNYKDERYKRNTTVELEKAPAREGYTFTGWYDDRDLTRRVTEIKMTGNKTVYAGWEPTGVPDWLNGKDHFAYVVGYADDTVRPLADISRAEVAAIFFRLLNEDIREENLIAVNTFSDVNEGMWYNTAISTMAKLGIVKGRSPASFDPDASITRAEFAAICARFDTSTRNGGSNFTDISGHWAESEIERAAALGWIEGYTDSTFRPENNITRAEAMAVINRVLNRLPEDEEDLLDGMDIWTDNQPETWYYLVVQEATNSHNFERKDDGVHECWTVLKEDPDWAQYEN